MGTQSATIIPIDRGFRCSACNGGVRHDATFCKHCGRAFVFGGAAAAAGLPSGPATGAALIDTQSFRQLEQILIPGEQVEAVFEIRGVGEGFMGITNKRLIFDDKLFLDKNKAIVSIPYSRIITIVLHDEAGSLTGRGFLSSSKISVSTVHGYHEFEFRSADKAYAAHNLILGHMM